MSAGPGSIMRAIQDYLTVNDSATIWELASALANQRGVKYADTPGGGSAVRRAATRLYEDGRLVTRTDGDGPTRYALADDQHGDGWTGYAGEPRPKELAALLAEAVSVLDASGKTYDTEVMVLRDLAATAAERGLHPVGGAGR